MKVFHQPNRFQDFVATTTTQTNAGIVTVTAAGLVIVSSDTPTYLLGQWARVGVDIRMLKGGASGLSELRLRRAAGTATMLNKDTDLSTRDLIVSNTFHLAGATWNMVYGDWFECSLGGTYQWELFGNSGGSDSTVAIGDARIEIQSFR